MVPRFLAPCFMIVCCLALSSALAGQHANSTSVATDPSGDVAIAGTTSGSGQRASDLTGLLLGGNATHLHATLELENLAQERNPRTSGATYLLYVEAEHVALRLEIQRSVPPAETSTPTYTSELARFNPITQEYVEVEEGAVIVPREADHALDIAIEYAKFEENDGPKLLPGFEMKGIYAEALGAFDRVDDQTRPDYLAYDRMPDQGELAWQLAHVGSGPLILHVDRPVRVTNGGATTFAFLAQIGNPTDNQIDVEFSVTGAPAQWQARSVDPVLAIPAQATINTTVLVDVPGGHTHGANVELVVYGNVLGTNLDASTPLYIRFTDTPQPAGHHDTLYLQSAIGSRATPGPVYEAQGGHYGSPFMSTVAPDDDAAEPSNNNDRNSNGFIVPLAPALSIGLDFDLDRVGVLEFHVEPFWNTQPQDVTLHGELIWNGSQEIILATMPEVNIGDVSGPTSGTLAVVPTPDSDYVRHEDGAVLELRVYYEFGGAVDDGAQPVDLDMLPAGFLRLPLNEFHDQTPLVPEAVLTIEGPSVVKMPPGGTGSFALGVRNLAVAEVAGHAEAINPRSTVWFAPAELRLGVSEETTMQVFVQPPEEAEHGWSERLTIAVRDNNGQPSALYAITVIVDESATSMGAVPSQASPMAPFVTVAAAVLAIAWARRFQ